MTAVLLAALAAIVLLALALAGWAVHLLARVRRGVPLLPAGRDGWADAVAAVSAEALERNGRAFLDLAEVRLGTSAAEASGDLAQRQQAIEHLVAPLASSLARVEAQLGALEAARTEAYVGLREQVGQLRATHELLQGTTANLVTALRAPAARGRWGELQLRRVVELAGMVAHCDFTEQATASDGDGGQRRPDLVVHLPGGAHVVVDAKVPLQGYLAALEAVDESDRRAGMAAHARQLRTHVGALAAKGYWHLVAPAPDLVVLFVPGESLLAAALEVDPALLDDAAQRNVLLATPVTLIALLRSVAMTWRHDALADNAREVCELGRELHRRLATMGDSVAAVGRHLDKAVGAYNTAVGSFETRVLVTARRFNDLSVTDGRLDAPEPVVTLARRLRAAELLSEHQSAGAGAPAALHEVALDDDEALGA